MTTAIRFPRPGERVKFQDGEAVLEGVCNGEPKNYDDQRPWLTTHLPVYVHDGDKCLMVGVGNIIEWPT